MIQQPQSIEQLRILNQKHAATIQSYLRCCSELHKSVPLIGLTSDIVAKIARKHYHINSEQEIWLEQNWQSCDLPLTHSFIQFKADQSTSIERNESRRLLVGSEANLLRSSRSMWERLVSAPYMASMLERDRYVKEVDVNEEDFIRAKRWIVILGDPGSGKTSFARRLTHHLAQTLLLHGQHATDYGPLRIPILIRIGEFAEVLQEQPSLTLFDYIGKHKWMGKNLVDNSSISLDDLSCALQDYVKHGQALIILDGLDEIPVSDQRLKIINVVEDFVDTSVLDKPSRSGGNQLIATSRIVGYHAAPLPEQFAHYIIQPMNREDIEEFINYWFYHLHQQILDILNLSFPNEGKDHAEALIKEFKKTTNLGLLDMASNPCLLSLVCIVSFSQLEATSLPNQRIRLYEQIVNATLTSWSNKKSSIFIPELIRILSDIAIYIHQHSASGLIHEEKMKELCIQSIQEFSNKKFYIGENLKEVEDQACEFVRIIRDDVGILVARGESLYGFIHLTFQEYFICLKLVDMDAAKQETSALFRFIPENKAQHVAQSLGRYMNDPYFRASIALAIVKLNLSWSQQDFDCFCLKFIQDHDQFSSLLPLGSYTIISCSNDFINYPSDNILFKILDSLMIAAGQHKWSVVCPFLFDQITTALRKLNRYRTSSWIDNLLSRSSSRDIQTISALCHLIEGKPHDFENIKWLNQSSYSILQSLLPFDNENNEFAIDRLLVKITFSNRCLLSVDPSTFKNYLLTTKVKLNSIPTVLFSLVITLYGGLKRDGQTVIFNPSHIYRESTVMTPILIHFLSTRNRELQDQNIIMIKEDCLKALQKRINNWDESWETVDLCIATICLCGIDYVRQNVNFIPSSLLRMSMNRFKYISMILRQFYFSGLKNDPLDSKQVTTFILNMIEKVQHNESSKEQLLIWLHSLRTSMVRLRSAAQSILFKVPSDFSELVTLHLPNCLRKEDEFLNSILSADKEFPSGEKSCSLLHYFTTLFWILEHDEEYNTEYKLSVAAYDIPQYLLFRNDKDLLFPLTFIPAHLRNLYVRLLEQKFIMVHSDDFTCNGREYFFFGHILTECLMLLSNTSNGKLSLVAALIALLILCTYKLENFGSSLLWTAMARRSDLCTIFNYIRQQPMNYETRLYLDKLEIFAFSNCKDDEERTTLINECIEQEKQRLQNALSENDDESINLYSACISLACVCRWTQKDDGISLLEQSVQGAMSINNKLVRLDALCMIAFYSHVDYNQVKVNKNRSLHEEINYQLQDIYSNLSLVLHTTIFIRCLPLLQDQKTVEKCLQNLFSKFVDAEQKDQQVVYEALLPYLESSFTSTPVLKQTSKSFLEYYIPDNKKFSVLMKYFNNDTVEDLSNSLLLSNLYLVELTHDLQKSVTVNDLHLLLPDSNLSILYQFEGPVLTVTQVLAITNIFLSASSMKRSKETEKLYIILDKTLHRFNLVEFKAHCLLESWMKWKDSNELCLFAWHAALLLVNSDIWSVEAAAIVCDLLCCENDRFRQRAEITLRLGYDDNIRTSSRLGIDVLLILVARKAHYQDTSPFANLTLSQMFDGVIFDNQYHLEVLLWLERYRVHKLSDKEYSLKKSKSSLDSLNDLNLLNDVTINVSFCDAIHSISNNLMQYICNLIKSHFLAFLEIDGDSTSNAVLNSHTQFIISVLVSLVATIGKTDKTRVLINDALTTLLEASTNNEIRVAVVYTLGNVCDRKTANILFDKIQMMMTIGTSNYSDNFFRALISSYCHCVSACEFDFDQDAMDLFYKLLRYESQDVLKAVHVGLGRVLKKYSMLLEMFGSDYIKCYHGLIGSTAYVFVHNAAQRSIEAVAVYIEQHPDLLPIFVAELYNSIPYYTDIIQHVRTVDFYLAYGYPQYVKVAELIAIRMPAAFCAFIKDWYDGDNLKRALFYTSKRHNYFQRAACITVLSIFGELAVKLCEMIIDGLCDDPHVQNTCHKCLTRINSIKDETVVVDLLLSYLKSKSMNIRYAAVKVLLHLSQSSLIPFNYTRTVLNDLMLDPSSSEDLWLIETQDEVWKKHVYYYAGPLRDVVYSLLVRHQTGDTNRINRRNQFNAVDADFAESEKASRFASCRYETKIEENLEEKKPSKVTYSTENSDDSTFNYLFYPRHETDQDANPQIDETQEIDNY